MKFVFVVLSGIADQRLHALSDRTPLAAAKTPALEQLAKQGRVGSVRVARDGAPDSPASALLALFGYDPAQHPLRQGPLEAAGADIDVGPSDLVLRGNLVTLYDETIQDPTAGRIRSAEARILLADVQHALNDPDLRIHPLGGYRFLAVVRNGGALDVHTTLPHVAAKRPVREVYPRGNDHARIARILDASRTVLDAHEVNRVRVDLGENPANFLWLWGEGSPCDLPQFPPIFGLKCAAVAGAPLPRGLARYAGIELVSAPRATGDLDTDLAAKLDAAIQALADHDFVFVHLNAAREATPGKDARQKLVAIQDADDKLLRPLVQMVSRLDEWRLMIATEHAEGAPRDSAGYGRAPFLLAGSDVPAIRHWPFDEEHALQSDLQVDDATALMEFFVGARR